MSSKFFITVMKDLFVNFEYDEKRKVITGSSFDELWSK